MPQRQTSLHWRSAWRDQVLSRLMDYQPDLILISAGFDAHRKDHINCGYLGLQEEDYEWLMTSVMKVAHSCCNGRVISVLEGGYRIQGQLVSAFARSVAAHARPIVSDSQAKYDAAEVEWERKHQEQQRIAQARRELQEQEAAVARHRAYLQRLQQEREEADAAAAVAAAAANGGGGDNEDGDLFGDDDDSDDDDDDSSSKKKKKKSKSSKKDKKRQRDDDKPDYAAMDRELHEHNSNGKRSKP
jgi:hypothetical protein